MTEEVQYPWTDNPTVSGVAECNTDILNDCLMHLKYDKKEGSGHDLFDLVLKDHILSFDESKGFALLGTYVYKTGVSGTRYGYPDFYNRCVAEKNAGTETEVTLGSNTITMYVNANGHQFYDIADKSAVDAWFDTYGIAWYYGIDEENERIFLPRATQYIGYYKNTTLPVSVYGTGKTLGMTNGSGNYGLSPNAGLSGYPLNAFSAVFNVNNGTSSTNGRLNGTSSLGVVTDPATSGLTGNVKLSFNGVEGYPYMVVGNTEQESAITDVVDVTTTENDTMPLFAPKYFDYKPNSLSWLKGGQQVNSGGIYTFAYNELVNERTTPKYELKVIETADKVSGTDYSEYWEVNQTEMWFKTPTKISYKALTGAVKGNGLTLGLTNGSTTGGLSGYSAGSTNAAISYLASYGQPVGATTTGTSQTGSLGITNDPTKSGVVVEESTAQLYFKVANAVQNLEVMDAGAITEALANKVDMTNTQWATNACMPDYTTGVSLTTGSIVTYDALGYCTGKRIENNTCSVKVDGVEVFYYSTGDYPKGISSFFPVPKGSTVNFSGQFGTSPKVYKLKGN